MHSLQRRRTTPRQSKFAMRSSKHRYATCHNARGCLAPLFAARSCSSCHSPGNRSELRRCNTAASRLLLAVPAPGL